MESIIEGLCVTRDYKSVSKKLNGAGILPCTQVKQFVQYVKDNRGKRKSTLSFEVILGESFFS